ncbi:MAG: LytTR family transcriptional regulator DNA-binding domain-containing protein [Clostridia bacterium]|nr:LytTR family transcriptional regulator DNA-binding domain-containing protein [Clostridia bacterium]
MKKTRVVIYDTDRADLEAYEKTCRDLGKRHGFPLEIKTYDSDAALLLDLESLAFRKQLDIALLPLENGTVLADTVRKLGYGGLLIFIGTERRETPYEDLFDVGAYSFVQRGKKHIPRFYEVFRRAAEKAGRANTERLALTYGGEIRQINMTDILFFQRRDQGMTVCYGSGETFYFIASLQRLENQLKGKNFCRISRTCLVSLDAASHIAGGEVIMREGSALPISSQFYPILREALGGLPPEQEAK